MSDYTYFTFSEFNCSCCDRNRMSHDFLTRLDELRALCGFPFVVNSGYRCENHPNEASKATPGTHNKGIAADIQVTNGYQRRQLVDAALEMNFGGIGVAKTFVHVDDRDSDAVMWTY